MGGKEGMGKGGKGREKEKWASRNKDREKIK